MIVGITLCVPVNYPAGRIYDGFAGIALALGSGFKKTAQAAGGHEVLQQFAGFDAGLFAG